MANEFEKRMIEKGEWGFTRISMTGAEVPKNIEKTASDEWLWDAECSRCGRVYCDCEHKY